MFCTKRAKATLKRSIGFRGKHQHMRDTKFSWWAAAQQEGGLNMQMVVKHMHINTAVQAGEQHSQVLLSLLNMFRVWG